MIRSLQRRAAACALLGALGCSEGREAGAGATLPPPASPSPTPSAPPASPSPTPAGCALEGPACLTDCAPDDPGCVAGFWDTAACACLPLGGCDDDAGCAAPRRCVGGACACPAPALPCSPDCDEAGGGCQRGRVHPGSCRCVRAVVRRMNALSVHPAQLDVAPGAEVRLAATGLFDDGAILDVTGSVRWQLSDPAVLEEVAPGRLRALAAGTCTLTAATGDLAASAVVHVVADGGGDPVAYEARGIWVARWSWRDAAGIRDIVRQVGEAGFNMLFFQVRGVCDAYYRSSLEPWAERLGGRLGADPGWDPLAVAVEEAHARGVELHAWLNSMACWTGALPPPASAPDAPEHVLRAHPDWAQVDAQGQPAGAGGSGYVFASPGVEAYRAHLAAVAAEIAERYAVDGVHLDYIRYAGAQYSHDPASRAAFEAARGANPGLQRAAWQRNQVSDAVRRVHAAVTAVRPAVKVSAATWGVYDNVWGWSGVSQGLHDYFQDAHAWTAAGTVDALLPMTYWPPQERPGDRLDFGTLVDAHVAGAHGRHVYAGVRADHEDFDVVAAMIERSRAAGAGGAVMFSWAYVLEYGLLPHFAAGPYAEPARPPPMPWK